VAGGFSICGESVRRCRRKPSVDADVRFGPSSSEGRRGCLLKRDVAEVRRARAVLKAASAY
jgi:transposase